MGLSESPDVVTNFHIIHNYTSLNTGWATIVLSTVNSFYKILPNSKFTVESYNPEIDRDLYSTMGIEVHGKRVSSFGSALHLLTRVLLWRILRVFHINGDNLLRHEKLNLYNESDIILDLGGDNLSVPLQTRNIRFKIRRNVLGILGHTYLFILFLLLKKKIVIYAQTIGPLGPLKSYVRYLLNKMSLITVREEESLRYVRNIGINKVPVYLTADPAFTLPVASSSYVDETLDSLDVKSNTPIVGICLSSETARYHAEASESDLVSVFSTLCDHIVERYKIQILLIPFSTWEGHGGDDRKIARKIWELSNYKNMVKLIQQRFDPRLTKGIISRCSVFIGSRGHSMMIALSSCIPTIAIGHNPKYYGIMKMAGQEKYVFKAEEITYEKLLSAFNNVWDQQNDIKNELSVKLPEIQDLSYLNAKLVKDLLVT